MKMLLFCTSSIFSQFIAIVLFLNIVVLMKFIQKSTQTSRLTYKFIFSHNTSVDKMICLLVYQEKTTRKNKRSLEKDDFIG